MLELKDIRKVYRVGELETRAVDGITVSFREKEFVAVLGESGSGKTTFLNIIGGLDRYDDGELIIKGKSTKNFKEREWDAYRNNSVGFVFQSYNLITHLSIVTNVELGMTLSGVSREEKHRRAVEVLEQVGLKEHLHKKPNQLSGGQMQRVAIARALANDPEILLCDEPTGALDSETSVQIMELIRSLSANRLVIMVTHNPALAEFPVYISPAAQQLEMEDMMDPDSFHASLPEQFPDTDHILLYDSTESRFVHENVITQDYIDYINAVDPALCSSVGSAYLANMNTLTDKNGTIVPVTFGMSSSETTGSMANVMSMRMVGLSTYPKSSGESYLEKNYDLLSGAYPSGKYDVVLVVDTRNRLDESLFDALGFDADGRGEIGYDEIVGKEYRVVFNDDYYSKTEQGVYIPNRDYEALYENENNVALRVCGVVRLKESASIGLLNTGICYSEELMEEILADGLASQIVADQKASDKSVFTLQALTEEQKEQTLAVLGGSRIPYMIFLYPNDFESKDRLLEYLDAYNEGRPVEEQVVYTDLAASISEMTGSIIDGITFVLIAFAAVSLVVSLIMICIITYTSVLERTKEIGILKSLGARKKDIARVFDAETCILGVFSGVLGIVIAWALTFPVNTLIYNVSELENVAVLQPLHALLLIVISTLLTMLGGHIPARIASRKNAVDALRSE